MSTHRYYMINRPPGIGCQPKETINREVWMPAKQMPGSERRVLGFVEYDHILTHDQIWSFELAPENVTEQAEHVFWAESRGDADPDWLKNDYLETPIPELQSHYKEWNDDKAWAALILLGETVN